MNAIETEINRRATLLCKDNYKLAGLEKYIETAMLIGASIVLENYVDSFAPAIEGLVPPRS